MREPYSRAPARAPRTPTRSTAKSAPVRTVESGSPLPNPPPSSGVVTEPVDTAAAIALRPTSRRLGVGVVDDDEQCRTAGLEGPVELVEEPLVEPERGQPRGGGSGDSADGGEQHGLQQQPHTPPAAAPLAAPTGASRIGCTSSTRPSSRR